MKRVHLQIIGNVQGVNFRYYLSKIAQQAGLTGWVKNSSTDYNKVEALIEGKDDEVERIIAWCRKGPPRAEVEDVKVVEEKVAKDQGKREWEKFEIK